MNLLSWFLGELHSSPSFKVRDGIHCAVSMMSQLGCGCHNNTEVLITVFLLLIQTNNNKYQFPSQVLPQASKVSRIGMSIWICCVIKKDVLIFRGLLRVGFVQRAGNIPLWTVSHSDFPLSRELWSSNGAKSTQKAEWDVSHHHHFEEEKRRKLLAELWGHNTIANFCVANWVEHNTAALNSKYPHTIKDFSTPKHPPWSRHH